MYSPSIGHLSCSSFPRPHATISLMSCQVSHDPFAGRRSRCLADQEARPLEGAPEVAAVGEALDRDPGDLPGFVAAAGEMVADEQPAVGILPALAFVVRQGPPGGAQRDRAPEALLRGGRLVEAIHQVA